LLLLWQLPYRRAGRTQRAKGQRLFPLWLTSRFNIRVSPQCLFGEAPMLQDANVCKED
jgi:hypothetical protein